MGRRLSLAHIGNSQRKANGRAASHEQLLDSHHGRQPGATGRTATSQRRKEEGEPAAIDWHPSESVGALSYLSRDRLDDARTRSMQHRVGVGGERDRTRRDVCACRRNNEQPRGKISKRNGDRPSQANPSQAAACRHTRIEQPTRTHTHTSEPSKPQADEDERERDQKL